MPGQSELKSPGGAAPNLTKSRLDHGGHTHVIHLADTARLEAQARGHERHQPVAAQWGDRSPTRLDITGAQAGDKRDDA